MPDFTNPSDDELVIRTERLVLRPPRTDDTHLLFDHCADPRLSADMTWAPHPDPGETKAFLTRCVQGRRKGVAFNWCVFEEGRFRGFVGIEGVVRRAFAVRYDRAELGYWVVLDQHNRGIMTEAAGAAVAYAFSRLALHKVIVRAFARNVASIRVIEKLGFTRIGVARADALKDGVWLDHVAFEMLADDPAAARLQSGLRVAR